MGTSTHLENICSLHFLQQSFTKNTIPLYPMRIWASILLLIMSGTVIRAAVPAWQTVFACERSCVVDDKSSDTDQTTCSANDGQSCCKGEDDSTTGCCTSGDCECVCCVHLVALPALPVDQPISILHSISKLVPPYVVSYAYEHGNATFHPPLD